MGFFDDLAMGFGLKPKTQDFVDRTAKTIERTQGSNAASNYASGQTNKGFANNYTPSEGSVPVIEQSSSGDDYIPSGGTGPDAYVGSSSGPVFQVINPGAASSIPIGSSTPKPNAPPGVDVPDNYQFAGYVDSKYKGKVPSFTRIGDETGFTIYADTIGSGPNEGKTGYYFDDIGDDVGSAGTGGYTDADDAFNQGRTRSGNYVYHYNELIRRGVALDDNAMETLNAALAHSDTYLGENSQRGRSRIIDTMNAVQNYENYSGNTYTITDKGAGLKVMPRGGNSSGQGRADDWDAGQPTVIYPGYNADGTTDGITIGGIGDYTVITDDTEEELPFLDPPEPPDKLDPIVTNDQLRSMGLGGLSDWTMEDAGKGYPITLSFDDGDSYSLDINAVNKVIDSLPEKYRELGSLQDIFTRKDLAIIEAMSGVDNVEHQQQLMVEDFAFLDNNDLGFVMPEGVLYNLSQGADDTRFAFDTQDAENLKRLKRAEIDIALLTENGEYNEVYDLNNDGKVSLLDVAHLNMQYVGKQVEGGEQRTDNFFNLMAQDFGTSIQGQQTQLADGVAAPVATAAEINMDANAGAQGLYSVTFNDVNGGSFNVLGRTVEEARAKARERGQAYMDNVMSSYNETGQMTDEERQILRDAIGWSQAYAPNESGAAAAFTLNQYEIDNLLAPTFARDPITGQASTINVSQQYNEIINSDISEDAKKNALAGLMTGNLSATEIANYDLTGDGVIDQSDIDTAQTNYLRANNAIIQDPSQSNLWSYSDSYGVGEGEQYVNFNTSGQGSTIAQTNMGELFQEGDRFKFKTKDGLIAREFGNVQDAIRFVSPNAGYEFGKFNNEFGEYDSYSPYYFTDRMGKRQDLSASEIADIDTFRAQGMTEQQINDQLKQKYDYRTIKSITGSIDGGMDVDTQTDMAFQGLSKPDRDTVAYEEPKTQDIYTRNQVTDQVGGMLPQYAAQPQFMQPAGTTVDPSTGTFVLGQTQSFAPSSGTQFNLPTAAPAALSTGVINAQPATNTGAYGYVPSTVGGARPMPYMAGRRLYNEGGVVPQQQLQSQGTFGGFKPQAMQRIANSLGYNGDMSGFEQYLNANPDKKQKMNEYTQKAVQMARGGSVKKPIYANNGTYVSGQSDPRILGQQYIPQQDFSQYEIDVPVYGEREVLDEDGNPTGDMEQYQTGTEKKMTGYNLQDVMAMQAVYPGLPEGATVVPTGVQFTQGQFVDPYSGQVYGSSAVPTALASTTQAGMPVATGANLMQATTGFGQMNELMSGVGAAQINAIDPRTGRLAANYAVDAAQGQSNLNIQAAQGQAYMMTNPMQRELQQGELISGVADAQKAAAFTEQIQAAQAEPSEKATVQGQLEGLMAQFESGDTPAWASGAMRAAMGAMAARGLGASSLAGQAVVQAAMESALPVAMADAQTQAQFEQQNLSNKQQRAMLAAQQRAQFMGQEFDQAFQARVANASKISDIANMNFTAEQQIALENSRAANTMELANLSNNQAAVMAEAAAIANMDMANLNNRQQAAVQNAQNFLQVDMANLSNRQQSELFRAQQRAQALFTDQAALNAEAQFNATSQNQVDQFFASLASQTSQFNASQANAQSQFNAGQTNVIERFNTEINNQREQFNAQNRLIIDQSNAQWRREVATMDTAAVNRANELNAEALLGYSRDAYNNLWQYYRDNMEWAWTAAENEKSRMSNLAIAQLQADENYDLTKMKQDYESNVGFGSLIGKILTTDLSNTLGGSILGDWFGFL